MTDFFADLEREIRAAHPRRSRPVVPVRGIAVSAAVAATLVALVLALGALSTGAEREVAQQPPPAEQGWTEYPPRECVGRVVDGRIPDALVDRFAVLRGDGPRVELDERRVPHEAAEVIRQSLRGVEGPGGRLYAFAVVRMSEADCSPGTYAVCLISTQSNDGHCQIPRSKPLLGYFVEDLPGDRRLVAVIADDAVRRASIAQSLRGEQSQLDLEGNTGFQVISGDQDVSIEAQ